MFLKIGQISHSFLWDDGPGEERVEWKIFKVENSSKVCNYKNCGNTERKGWKFRFVTGLRLFKVGHPRGSLIGN